MEYKMKKTIRKLIARFRRLLKKLIIISWILLITLGAIPGALTMYKLIETTLGK